MNTTKYQSANRLASLGFKVFPLLENKKIPMPFMKNWPEKATDDKNQVHAWWSSHPTANIGIATKGYVVVDVDFKNEKDGFKTLANLKKHNNLPDTLMQKTASGSLHLFFKSDTLYGNKVNLWEGIDIRADGGFVVGHGSTIGRGTYEMDFTHEIAELPEWIANKLSEKKEKSTEAKEVIQVDPKRAEADAMKFLNARPTVTSGERNHEAFKAASFVKDFGCDYDQNLFLMGQFWKCEPPLEDEELEAVVRSAYKYGGDAQGSKSIEAQLPELEEAPEAKNPFQILSEEYAFCSIGGNHRILRESTDYKGKRIVEHLSEPSFHAKLANRFFQPDGDKPKSLSKEWIKSGFRRSYDGLVFAPEQKVNERFYNTWRGFSVEPLTEDEQPTKEMLDAYASFTEHALENVCHGDVELYQYLMTWFAHIVQKPWEKPLVATVFKGKKGTGKNALLNCVGNLFKDNYMVTASRRHVVGNFNSHLESLLYLVLDEAFWSGDKEQEGILKDLITGETVEIERKGVDSYSVESCLRVSVIGNEAWLVPATEDERRFAVFSVGEGRRLDVDFFTAMRKNMEAGGYRYLLTKLKSYDISKVNVAVAPKTEGLVEQQLASLSPLEKYWHDSLYKGYFEGVSSMNDGEWQTTVDFKNFTDAFISTSRSRRGTLWIGSDGKLMEDIKAICPSATFGRAGLMTLELPSLTQARDEWDKRLKTKTDWEK
jgi:hypothetical protein